MDPVKVKAITDWQAPKTVKQVQVALEISIDDS